MLKFKIVLVRSGWFVFRLGNVEVWTSRIWGRDSPRELLALLGRCIGGGAGTVEFWSEPERWCLSIQGGEAPEMMLGNSDGEVLRWENADLFGFAWKVAEAFGAWDREQYAEGWMPFPEKELHELRQILGDFS